MWRDGNKDEIRKRSRRDTYMALIREFALKPIRNDDEHERAVQIIAKLMGRKLDSGMSDYLNTRVGP